MTFEKWWADIYNRAGLGDHLKFNLAFLRVVAETAYETGKLEAAQHNKSLERTGKGPGLSEIE